MKRSYYEDQMNIVPDSTIKEVAADDVSISEDMYEDIEDLRLYNYILPTIKIPEPIRIPLFNVQDVCTDVGNLDMEDKLSDADDDNLDANLMQSCPTVHLPKLQLRKIEKKAYDKNGILLGYQGIKSQIYRKLPPDIRDAVMHTHRLNASVAEFFQNSQWTMFLQSKRKKQMRGNFRKNKVNRRL